MAGFTAGTQNPSHLPVMWTQVMEGLRVLKDGRYLDGTFGRGGHARGVLDQLGPAGRLLLMDKDPEAIASAAELFGGDSRVAVRRGSFARPGRVGRNRRGSRRRAVRPRRVLAAARRRRARLQLPQRRPAGHAHGSGQRRKRRAVARPRQRHGNRRRAVDLWRGKTQPQDRRARSSWIARPRPSPAPRNWPR